MTIKSWIKNDAGVLQKASWDASIHFVQKRFSKKGKLEKHEHSSFTAHTVTLPMEILKNLAVKKPIDVQADHQSARDSNRKGLKTLFERLVPFGRGRNGSYY